MEKLTLSRAEFYALIWSEPLSHLGKKYAISDNGLRKMCKKYNVPIPKNGYWIKLKYNKPVKAEKLPHLEMEKDIIELCLREEGSALNMDASPETVIAREIKADAMAPLLVPEELENPHLLIKETKRHWADLKKHKRDYNYDDSIPRLSIHVEEENRPRALRFFDTLIKLLEYRGHKVITRQHSTFVVIGGIETRISLREASNRVFKTYGHWPTSDLVPNGKLYLKTGEYSWHKQWRENKIQIETMLPKIVAKLELDSKKEAERREENRLYHIRREEQEQIRREKLMVQKKEQEKFDMLLKQAEQHDNAQKIRNLIAAKQQMELVLGNLSDETLQWIDWASRKADWYDPLTDATDEILDAII